MDLDMMDPAELEQDLGNIVWPYPTYERTIRFPIPSGHWSALVGVFDVYRFDERGH